MQRYFINKNQIINNTIKIKDNDYHHIKNVMRMKIDDEVIACDQEKSYLCKIISVDDYVNLEIINTLDDNAELLNNVTIAHGLVRREKTEEVIRRLVELGCHKYIPVLMNRSVVRHTNDKQERYMKIIKEASEQSERQKLMEINEIISYKELLALTIHFDLVLFCHTINRQEINLKKVMQSFTGHNILVIIGPEGGFSDNEVKEIMKTKAQLVSLGRRILRTETAPLYVMSILAYEVENEG